MSSDALNCRNHTFKAAPEAAECSHCWHGYEGAYMAVLHSGELIQECCKCRTHRTIHRDHA